VNPRRHAMGPPLLIVVILVTVFWRSLVHSRSLKSMPRPRTNPCRDLGVATGVGHAMSGCVPRPLALAHVHEILTHQHHEVHRPFGSQVAAHESDMCQFACQALERPLFIVDLCYTAKRGQLFALSQNSCP
jgi:hypothetical protein